MNVYFNDFSSKEDVFQQFRASEEDYKDIEILFATYSYEDYSGTAFVLFSQNQKLYEVNGSHCSCYGLEDQWSPEETSVEALLFRLNNGQGYGWSYIPVNELKEILESIRN